MVTYAIGPRATPTVDGDRVYVVGATGRMWCLDVESGDVIWQHDFVEEYDTSVPTWGVTSAPLVDGNRVITLVGGEPDALVVAFDRDTGEEVWRALDVYQEMGYAQPVIYEAGGVRTADHLAHRCPRLAGPGHRQHLLGRAVEGAVWTQRRDARSNPTTTCSSASSTTAR